MAQHYQIKDQKIIRSIHRIAPKVFNDIMHNLKMDWSYYGKDISHLPSDYNPTGHAFLIKPYNIKKVKGWENEPYAEENACLEVHLNSVGEIEAVYYAL